MRARAPRPAYRAQTIRALNRQLVMTVLRQSGAVSRSEIAAATGLSHSAAVDIVAELEARELVESIGVGNSAGGRRPALVKMSSSGPLFVGLHLSPTAVTGLLAAADGTVQARVSRSADSSPGPSHLIELLGEVFQAFLEDCPEGGTVCAFGLSVSGPIGPEGTFDPPDMPGWERHPPLLDRLVHDLGVPGAIDNDANLGALAELYFGEGARAQSLVYVLVHHGLGAGVIVDGSVYSGHTNRAGELGHMMVDPSGAQCDCGNYGCLETFVSTRKLVDYARQRMRLGRRSDLRADDPRLTADQVLRAALAGDQAAVEAFREMSEWLGIALSNVVHFFNPETVIVGGPLADAGSLILGPAESLARDRLLPALRESLSFRISPLGGDGPILGAAALACDRFVAAQNSSESSAKGVLANG